MTSLADRLYALLLEGLVFLGINPVECSAVGMLQKFSLTLLALLGAAIVLHRCGSIWLERRAGPLDDARIDTILRACVTRSGLGYQPRLLEAPLGSPPVFAAGGRRGVIYLHPELVGRFDDGELEAVLLHELAHLRERDHLFVSWFHLLVFFSFAIVAQAWIIAFFFESASLHFGSLRAQVVMGTLLACYLAIRAVCRRPLGHLREIDCDDAAVEWGTRPADLASALVKTGRMKLDRLQGARATSFMAALTPQSRDLEARVRRLVASPRPRLRARLMLRKACVIALAGILLFVVSFHVRSAASPNPPSGWAQIVIP